VFTTENPKCRPWGTMCSGWRMSKELCRELDPLGHCVVSPLRKNNLTAAANAALPTSLRQLLQPLMAYLSVPVFGAVCSPSSSGFLVVHAIQ